MSDSPREIDFCVRVCQRAVKWRSRDERMAGWNLGPRRCGMMRPQWWRRGPGTEEEKARTEDARRASREATEEHGKPIN